jgi:hypothetical protein
MIRALIAGLAAALALAGCGSSSTKTVTSTAQSSSSTSSTETAASPPLTLTSSSSSSTATTAQVAVYFQGVAGPAQQRPKTLELTGDGTLFVQGVQWSSWGGATATGTGNAVYHGCTPTCAQAPVNRASVSISMSGVRVCSGRRYYSGLKLTLSSGRLLEESFVRRPWSPC